MTPQQVINAIVSDLNNIVRAIEESPGGDEVRLASTNDADRLREIAELVDEHRTDCD
jgi:hypothetical protein